MTVTHQDIDWKNWSPSLPRDVNAGHSPRKTGTSRSIIRTLNPQPTLVQPQLEYASTVWSPHTATDITKLEAVQRRSACSTRHYQRTSSVTQMITDLNWCSLEQRRIDSRHTLMYKITYDLVAIPAADYLIPNTRQSRHNHLHVLA